MVAGPPPQPFALALGTQLTEAARCVDKLRLLNTVLHKIKEAAMRGGLLG